VASSRLLFFPSVAFAVFDGDGFILQVHGVFTRIRSGATTLALYGARGWIYKFYSVAAVRTSDSWPDLLGLVSATWGEKP
jgi:hypothetical protein